MEPCDGEQNRIECPHCRNSIDVTDDASGLPVGCPRCHAMILVEQKVCSMAEVIIPPYSIRLDNDVFESA